MRKIVDSNFLQTPELDVYLSNSKSNYAVLTDYVAMEAYKDNTLESIFKSMCLLCRYPNQILVLKGTAVVSGLRFHEKGLLKRFIDSGQSKDFPKFCKDLSKAEKGDEKRRGALLSYGKDANQHMEKILNDADGVITAIAEIATNYTPQELRIFRKKEPYSIAMISKIFKHVIEVAKMLFSSHPNVNHYPSQNDLTNSFIFRYALCMYLLTIHWISEGGAQRVSPKKMRNDMVDMNYVAYATYFDGLLSKDKKVMNIHAQAKFLLCNVLHE